MESPIRAGVMTISDRSSRGERADESGPLICSMLEQRLHAQVVETGTVPDEQDEITELLIKWAERGLDLIITTGGTGFAPRDVTPEATLRAIERRAPGIEEALRTAGMAMTPYAMLSRAVAGIRGRTMIVNMPGSPKAARENMEVILPVISHAVGLLRGTAGDASHQGG